MLFSARCARYDVVGDVVEQHKRYTQCDDIPKLWQETMGQIAAQEQEHTNTNPKERMFGEYMPPTSRPTTSRRYWRSLRTVKGDVVGAVVPR